MDGVAVMGAQALPLPERLLLTTEQAASYCGVSANTFRAHVRVRAVRVGSLIRYDRRDLDKWASSQGQSEPVTADDWLERLDAGARERP